MPLTSYEVTPSGSEKYGIKVHGLDYRASCKGKQFYISAPNDASWAQVQLRARDSDIIVANMQLNILEIEPYSELEPTATSSVDDAWMTEWRKNEGFLAKGFRGVSFCLAKNFISRSTFQFISKRAFWNMGPLEK